MKFCKNLVRDINFDHDAIQPCCNTHGIVVPRFAFSGCEFDFECYSAHIQKVANLIQNQDKTDICKNCQSLQDIDKNGLNAEIKFVTVSLNMHRFLCNCKCVYCNFLKKYQPSYRILPVLKKHV
ncbi:MAG: hypothetical protein IJS50_05755 [Desulfovibrio sp.]|nr:hypothetical protein [Desulfovibrio sp.]